MVESIKHRLQALNNSVIGRELKKLWDSARTELAALRTLINELRADHATFKTAADQTETLIEELHDDHATFKTAADQVETLIEELHDDAATQKTLNDELIVDHATAITWSTEVDADHDTMNNIADFDMADGVIGGDFTIAGTAAVTLLGAGHVRYRIGGQEYYTALDTTITLQDSGDIIQNKYGAWRILIDRTGAVTTQDTGAQMAWDNAEDALLNLSAVAPTANTVTIGYCTITDSGAGGFNIGTTNTTGGTATEVLYHVRNNPKKVTGLHTANGAASTVGATPTNYSTGTKDVMLNGVRITQIAAEADKSFDDLDTIGQSQYGGWVIVTNLAKNATYSLAADGKAGAVSAMTYASSAAAQTAIDNVIDRLPSMFCPISQVIITNNLAGVWTAGTDDLNGTDGTAAWTDATVGTWDRTNTTGFDSHKITRPTIPASITAPLVATLTATAPATLTAPKPASAPATLTAPKPASAPATITAAAVSESLGE